MTTHAASVAVYRLQASLAQLSQALGINARKVATWREGGTVKDRKTGPNGRVQIAASHFPKKVAA